MARMGKSGGGGNGTRFQRNAMGDTPKTYENGRSACSTFAAFWQHRQSLTVTGRVGTGRSDQRLAQPPRTTQDRDPVHRPRVAKRLRAGDRTTAAVGPLCSSELWGALAWSASMRESQKAHVISFGIPAHHGLALRGSQIPMECARQVCDRVNSLVPIAWRGLGTQCPYSTTCWGIRS